MPTFASTGTNLTSSPILRDLPLPLPPDDYSHTSHHGSIDASSGTVGNNLNMDTAVPEYQPASVNDTPAMNDIQPWTSATAAALNQPSFEDSVQLAYDHQRANDLAAGSCPSEALESPSTQQANDISTPDMSA
jgi:hypothetical protein